MSFEAGFERQREKTRYQAALCQNARGCAKKKPRGRELHPIQKTINQVISKVRVTVEHAIAGIKRCHIVADTFRNRRDGFVDEVILVASGLHNLRVTTRTMVT